MMRRLIFLLWVLMLLIIVSTRWVGRMRAGHLFMYSRLDTDELIILDIQTMKALSYPSRLAYQNAQWSTSGSRFYFSRTVDNPEANVRFAFNLFSRDVIASREWQLLDTHAIALSDGSSMGHRSVSPDGSRVAYISTIEGKSYFAVVDSEGNVIVDLNRVQISAPQMLIWSEDSQSIYLLNQSNRRLTAYQYDFESEILSGGQVWLETEERLVAMYPSPSGDLLLFYENNSDTLYAYKISEAAIYPIVRYDGNVSLESFHDSLVWSRDGQSFILAYWLPGNAGLQIEVYATDGTIQDAVRIQLPYSSATVPTLSLAGRHSIVSIATPGYPICFYYFISSHLQCLSTGIYTHAIGFSA